MEIASSTAAEERGDDGNDGEHRPSARVSTRHSSIGANATTSPGASSTGLPVAVALPLTRTRAGSDARGSRHRQKGLATLPRPPAAATTVRRACTLLMYGNASERVGAPEGRPTVKEGTWPRAIGADNSPGAATDRSTNALAPRLALLVSFRNGGGLATTTFGPRPRDNGDDEDDEGGAAVGSAIKATMRRRVQAASLAMPWLS